ncbi:DUF1491 family protein [Arvimicrobium flavum]|uniref:DUF1491 family protein n=1 Tax=Arvimicrobium flavum TaxID=3393320 RepID=UPI00237A9D50|nr:DUF1491 family protein [Mesorhizobium shangrilense]
MRLTTDFWVSALIRNVFRQGGFAAVLRRGATEAGAVFVTVRNRYGQVTLYGPAAQASYDTAKPDDRLFSVLMSEAEEEAVEQRLAKEARFDPDIWVVELEPGDQEVAELLNVTTP